MSMEMDDDVGRLLKTMLLKKSQLKGLKGSIGDVNVAGASGDARTGALSMPFMREGARAGTYLKGEEWQQPMISPL